MSTALSTFDESWHQVMPRRVRLRPGVEVHAQRFRGQRWYVIRDSLSGKFFRVRPAAYEFICEMERAQTVGEAWERCLQNNADHAPGQGEVVHLLGQLHRSSLIRSDVEGDAKGLAEIFAKEKQREAVQRWSSLLFFRMPLWCPDAFLRSTGWVGAALFSRWGALLWLALVLWGGSEIMASWNAFMADTSGLLGLANLGWLYLVMAVIKVLHELGHGYACRKLGGEVPEMGIMLLMFNPLPYVDASASTAFRSKWDRILVGGAGMLVETGFAGIAAVVWAHTGTGTLHMLACNAVVAASVVTILFNANPLLRYDGYHMLSDWLELPNLQGRSTQSMQYLLERYLFGLKGSRNPAASRHEGMLLVVYWLASWSYRLLITFGILFLISQHYLGFGILLAVVFSFMWVLLPVLKSIHFLFTSPRLERCRFRACGLTAALVAALLGFLWLVPFPNHFRAFGVVRAEPFARVYTGVEGRLARLLVPSGTLVKAGTILLELDNPELQFQQQQLESELTSAEVQRRVALETDPARYISMRAYFEALELRRLRLLADMQALTVHAPCDGLWLAPDLLARQATTMSRGLELGVVQNDQAFSISAVVKQEDVSRLFTPEQVRGTEVRVVGQEGVVLGVTSFAAIPSQRESLPSAALGLAGGGTVAVANHQPGRDRKLPGPGMVEAEGGNATHATESIFEIRAHLQPASDIKLVHGQRVIARMTLEPAPLGSQWWRMLWQTFQRTYKL
jgi:putative peptide zinc metalloprotease protein